ncbi:DNA repair helicase XPB [Paenibacillus turpanensis]|uniref:DNA repair helicase XPB n=1 Tax=Paenibacillus turpanensis TaxID=2689078 RepID=UPI00140AB2DF|nr:DNA repair helicase XPB [Paenibacillus turpanensis]
MMSKNLKPLIVQNDFSLLLEVRNPLFEEARARICGFADLVKSPEHVHTYRMSPLSLWNAAAAGWTSAEVVAVLEQYAKFPVPSKVKTEIAEYIKRYGMLVLEQTELGLILRVSDAAVYDKISAYPSLQEWFEGHDEAGAVYIKPEGRGVLKQELVKLGYPVQDFAGFSHGEAMGINLKETLPDGRPFELRSYQRESVEAFYRGGTAEGGSGVLVLPCGAGKTVLGIAIMARLQCETLILTTNVTSVRQWRNEIINKTTLDEDQVGEYSGTMKDVKPVTIATYQILTHRRTKQDIFSHMGLFNQRNWGLIIYDEVHLLPAPVFRATADIQAKRRLGLTATLVREDGCEEDVFSLVGPKRIDVPWRSLEEQGWIAKARCVEIRVPMPEAVERQYEAAEPKEKFRIAGENPWKMAAIGRLLKRHDGLPTIIIGQYLDQLSYIAEKTGAPLITGQVPHEERERIFAAFRSGERSLIVVSKVANFAVDLPDAAVAIQVSGSFGSRQEEAQRLGRVLRPKQSGSTAYFYSLVSHRTNEQDFAMKRQLFLVEQGYRYEIQTIAITEPEMMLV